MHSRRLEEGSVEQRWIKSRWRTADLVAESQEAEQEFAFALYP